MIGKFIRNNIVVLVFVNIGNVLNYIFQLILGRSLSVNEFGEFNSIVSLAIITSTPIAVLPLVISKYTVELSEKANGFVKYLLLKSLMLASILAVIGLAVGFTYFSEIKEFLHLDSSLPLYLMFFWLSLSLVFPVFYGVIQGLHRFYFYSIGLMSVSLFRVISAIFLVSLLQYGVNGALAAEITGTSIALLIGLYSLKDMMRISPEKITSISIKDVAKFTGPVFISTSLITLFGNLDLVLVRHYCTPDEAGFYATGIILGRIAMFLPGVLVNVLFPEASKRDSDASHANKILYISLVLTFFLSGIIVLIFTIWPEEVITLMLGEKYQKSASFLINISIAMGFLALSNVIFTFSSARSEFTFIYFLLLGTVIMLVLIYLNKDHALIISKMVMYANVGIFFVTFIWRLLLNRRVFKMIVY